MTAIARQYLELCKPRVVALMLLSALVGMLLAFNDLTWSAEASWGMLGIAFAASAGAAYNHIIDRHYDIKMHRTNKRPLPQGMIHVKHAGWFASLMLMIGGTILWQFTNPLTAGLTVGAMLGYAFLYTAILKHLTPQNIVIGGLFGALPPLLGWTAITNHIDALPLLLVLIIYLWTPPHFWALAIYRRDDYARAGIPMLPVTHGLTYTRLHILFYSWLTVAATYLLLLCHTFGWLYLVATTLLNARFIYWAIRLYKRGDAQDAMRTFRYSIVYLMLYFVVLITDRLLSLLAFYQAHYL